MFARRRRHNSRVSISFIANIVWLAVFISTANLIAAPPARITSLIVAGRTRAISGNVHLLAQAQYDQGAVDPGTPMNDMVLMVKPSAAQQAELDQLLADRQNPSSPQFHKWLTPEEFGGRFGLNPSDQSKLAAWLNSSGFTVKHLSRARNWIAFSGTASQVSAALKTSIHRFQVDGTVHIANATDPAVPEALADVIAGFLGLNDFPLKSLAKQAPPDYNTGGTHYLAPADFSTIYDLNPLYAAGVDGTGQSIAVVGESDVLLSDIRTFRTRYGLAANDPKMYLYGTDPGYNSAELEGNLDLEWSGAIAPKATIYYVYGASAFTAIVYAVELDFAPVVSISYGFCEINYSAPFYRSVAQQANAQGITLLSASGDSGAAGCQDRGTSATRGRSVQFPAAMPEVTAVGGTEFVEGDGNYWAPANSGNLGSALGYIPEAVWNETSSAGLTAGGGGVSIVYSKPAWQIGPGVPADGARDVPDVAFSSALHDAYYITYQGLNTYVYGTSAAAPSMAGIVALLNQYQVANGFQSKPGLGNINPQLYRLAQSAPSVFHDITSGNNIVPCEQGSPDCSTGSFGYQAGTGYDMASGLGSVDANALVTNWNTAAAGVVVTLSANNTTPTLNDTIQLTATVAPATGSGTPTGTVNFVFGTIPLGIATLSAGSATISFPVYLLDSVSVLSLAAQYSGDATFSSGGATLKLLVTIPSSAAAILPIAPNTVWAQPPDAQGLSWQTTISLQEIAGVPAMVTGLTLDGQTQNLSQYFSSTSIPANGTLTTDVIFRNLSTPMTRVFVFSGTDAAGHSWSRQVSVIYQAQQTDDFFNVSVTPLSVTQNKSADPSCQWPVQLNVDDMGGYGVNVLEHLYVGGLDFTDHIATIFGTTRLDAWEGIQGTLCFSGIAPPTTDEIEVILSDGNSQDVTVSFTGPPANANVTTVTPSNITLAAPSAGPPAQTTLAVNLSDKTQTWTASVYPANRTTAWLSLSQLSGTGSGQITLTASGSGFEPSAYRATIVIQSTNSAPQYLDVPVMFVLGGSTSGTTVTAVVSSATFQAGGAPGMEMSIFGTQLANTTATGTGNPLPFSTAGVGVTVNGLAAPVTYVSSTFLNIQVPYEVGAGPAVLSVNNNGQVAGFQFQIAPSAPGIFSDRSGNLVPSATVQQGGIATLYMTGAGDVSPTLKTAYAPAATALPSSLPKPVLPLAVTIGGAPAFLEFVGLAPTLVGTTVVNFLVPASVPAGVQSLVVSVNGVASPPVNLNVLASTPAPGSQE